MKAGAIFSEDRKHRYILWRVWDDCKPAILFIGLNPSTANETQSDPTITKVIGFAKLNGFGSIYMGNCFSQVTSDPKKLSDFSNIKNDEALLDIKKIYGNELTVVFAWGAFEEVKKFKRDVSLCEMFPDAMALVINKDGSPRHPLYVPYKTRLIKYNKK